MGKVHLRILWLATDRSSRVARIFDPLREEVSKIVHVDSILKKLPMVAGQYIKAIKENRLKEKPVVNVKDANEYDIIMVDAPFAFTNEKWSQIKTKKVVLFEDQHGFNPEISKMFMKKGFNCFFTRYNNILLRHKHLKNSNIIWLPHSIDDTVIKDYELKKEIGALMVGMIQSNTYPLRNFTDRQLSGKKWYRRVERPRETLNKTKKWPVGEDYAKLINSSWISFSCLSKFRYPVLKFFEIPGCNSVLFSDYDNQLKKLGFVPGKNMIEISPNMNNFGSFIKKHLNNTNRLEDISNKGYELVHKRHTVKKRAEEFLNYMDGLK